MSRRLWLSQKIVTTGIFGEPGGVKAEVPFVNDETGIAGVLPVFTSKEAAVAFNGGNEEGVVEVTSHTYGGDDGAGDDSA